MGFKWGFKVQLVGAFETVLRLAVRTRGLGVARFNFRTLINPKPPIPQILKPTSALRASGHFFFFFGRGGGGLSALQPPVTT